MFTCYVCKKRIDDADTLFSHIKHDHPISFKEHKYECRARECFQEFSNFSSFKRHVRRCHEKPSNSENLPQYHEAFELFTNSIDENLLNFEETLNEAVLKFVCGLCSNMNTPRKEIYYTIAQFKETYLSKLVAGKFITKIALVLLYVTQCIFFR